MSTDGIPHLQASVFGTDGISELSSCFAPAGSFVHQERRPHGLWSHQDCTYRCTFLGTISVWPPAVIKLMIKSSPLSSFTSCVSVQVSRRPNFKELYQDHARCQRWLNEKGMKAFYTTVFADNLRHGTQFLLQVETPGCNGFIHNVL